jgi:hypothetical protein
VNAAHDTIENSSDRGWRVWPLLGAGIALALVETVLAQGTVGTPKGPAAPAAGARISVDVLKGAWVRPDGGYTIEIRSIDPNGRVDATYYNPKALPFAKAQALPEGSTLRAFFEIQAGGYAGSTYELAYDPASDRLKGIYYQAVVKQKFDVVFVRK